MQKCSKNCKFPGKNSSTMFLQANLVADQKHVRCLSLIFGEVIEESEIGEGVPPIQTRSLEVEAKHQQPDTARREANC